MYESNRIYRERRALLTKTGKEGLFREVCDQRYKDFEPWQACPTSSSVTDESVESIGWMTRRLMKKRMRRGRTNLRGAIMTNGDSGDGVRAQQNFDPRTVVIVGQDAILGA